MEVNNNALGAMVLVTLLVNASLEDYLASSLKKSKSLKEDKLKSMKPPKIEKRNMKTNMLMEN